MARLARVLLIVSLAAVTVLGCRPRVDTNRIPPPSTNDTTLGAGDVFDVRVFGEASLSGTYRVGPDGAIDYPLIGAVEVAGLEPSAVAVLLRDRLRDGEFLVDPHVSVFVQEYASKRISVVGSVGQPGTFPVTPGMTLVQAISLAGGFSETADRNGTTLTRRVDGEVRHFRIPVDDITSGRTNDIPVGAGDIINVPRRVF